MINIKQAKDSYAFNKLSMSIVITLIVKRWHSMITIDGKRWKQCNYEYILLNIIMNMVAHMTLFPYVTNSDTQDGSTAQHYVRQQTFLCPQKIQKKNLPFTRSSAHICKQKLAGYWFMLAVSFEFCNSYWPTLSNKQLIRCPCYFFCYRSTKCLALRRNSFWL